MQWIAYTVLIVSTLLTIGIVYWYFTSKMKHQKTEGFVENEKIEIPQANISQIMGTIQRLSSSFMDMNMWSERVSMSQMTPTELARKYLNSKDNKEK